LIENCIDEEDHNELPYSLFLNDPFVCERHASINLYRCIESYLSYPSFVIYLA
jgi:hypothetical protein